MTQKEDAEPEKAKEEEAKNTAEEKKLEEEQIINQRKLQKRRLESDLRGNNRELEYKQFQLTNGILEKSETSILIARSFPKDDVKPSFMIENEIDVLKVKSEEINEQLKGIEEMEREDAAKPS
ncbi:MAG TPA: hypothetical protein ENI23_02360 [bacterium]|nr:hypothetical protein [bacterium]